ncbi:MAG: hypothetical protein U9P38_03020 [Campylobacterota bacterium]|nr:hypothetical protein [Campylobacterota bacterium]
MRDAIIDQMLLWIVLFIGFVGIFLMVIDYYLVLKTKDRCDTFANYGVRMKALGRDEATIVTGLNNIKNSYFQTITVDDLSCVEDSSSLDYRIVFQTETTFDNLFLSQGEMLRAKTASFNEVNSSNIECNLILKLK